MGQPMLVFHNDSDSSYANYAGNLSSISIAATAVTLRFLGQGTSTSGTDAVVLSCAAGNEEAVLEAVAGAAAEGRSSMTIIADDKNSKYLIPEITGVTSISINTGAAHIENVIVLTDDRTLTVAESGSTVMMNHAAKVITLPPAQAGLNFKIGFYQDTTAVILVGFFINIPPEALLAVTCSPSTCVLRFILFGDSDPPFLSETLYSLPILRRLSGFKTFLPPVVIS